MDRLKAYYFSVAPELAKAREAIEKVASGIPEEPITLVMAERPADNPRPTFVHNRGEYLAAEANGLSRGCSRCCRGCRRTLPRNRLGLASWLVSGSNPLTGRVTMNYQWAAFFGRGIVRTVEDFGYQGERPTHPELLDYLAISLVEQSWSMKAMHRAIVTSATYRQSSRVSPELLAKDPENRLLARGSAGAGGGGDDPRLGAQGERTAFRTDWRAECFPAAAAGCFDRGGVWRAGRGSRAPGATGTGAAFIRSRKRTAPFAMAVTFDGPSGEVCVARREMSNSPLQALTLLNDPAFVEGSQALGALMAKTQGTVEARIGRLYRLCLSRAPERDELSVLAYFFENQRGRLERKELDAGKIAGNGGEGAIERAVWTLLARAILNLDEAVTKG